MKISGGGVSENLRIVRLHVGLTETLFVLTFGAQSNYILLFKLLFFIVFVYKLLLNCLTECGKKKK